MRESLPVSVRQVLLLIVAFGGITVYFWETMRMVRTGTLGGLTMAASSFLGCSAMLLFFRTTPVWARTPKWARVLVAASLGLNLVAVLLALAASLELLK
jgi:hypothetical protein